MSDQPAITAEQVAEYQRQQVAAEQAAHQAFGEALAAFLRERNYEIIAWPIITQDGRTVAQWGFRRVVTP